MNWAAQGPLKHVEPVLASESECTTYVGLDNLHLLLSPGKRHKHVSSSDRFPLKPSGENKYSANGRLCFIVYWMDYWFGYRLF